MRWSDFFCSVNWKIIENKVKEMAFAMWLSGWNFAGMLWKPEITIWKCLDGDAFQTERKIVEINETSRHRI